MTRYAETATVPVTRSLDEIRAILKRYDAGSFVSGEVDGQVVVMFEMSGRRVRFKLPLPSKDDQDFRAGGSNQHAQKDRFVEAKYEQAIRRRYRALVLAIKAKLESVEAGIEVFDEAFMAQIILPDGRTMSEVAVPQIATAYLEGKMPPLLAGGNGSES